MLPYVNIIVQASYLLLQYQAFFMCFSRVSCIYFLAAFLN